MKKILSIALVVLMALTTLVSCGSEAEAANVNFGMGVYTYYGEATSADGETNGAGEVLATVAAVLVDADGKIVACDIDCADISVEYTSAGAAVVADAFKTKAELGTDYGMAAYGADLNGDGKVLEWNEQADALEGVVVGKTVDEVKALVVDGYYGTEEVQTAGCTIGISDYIKAVEKAVANAAESTAKATDTVKVGVVTSASATDATADAEGSIEVDITVAAAATDADGKITACATDVAVAEVTFTALGEATTDTAAEILTKLEKGADYGMAAYGADLNGDGKVLEWNEQAAAFNTACTGLTATEVAALVVDGYGVEDVQTAGCTIGITDMAAAMVKAAQ
ncbi:MAG: hypothetical protein IJ002_01725 [Clostridia bacterium]|nr:hypothetical protein [Clostridia bacterium]